MVNTDRGSCKGPLKNNEQARLIAGATGTGKTKTLQVISEQLSERGVPVLLMDVRNSSGIAVPERRSHL